MIAVARLTKPLVCSLAVAVLTATLWGSGVAQFHTGGERAVSAADAIAATNVPLAGSVERRVGSGASWRAPSPTLALPGTVVTLAFTTILRTGAGVSAPSQVVVTPRGLRGYDAAAPPEPTLL